MVGLYGKDGLDIFKDQAPEYGICIQKSEQLKLESTAADYDDILTTFRKSNLSKVIICFCEGEAVRELLKAAQRANESHKYIFIGR